MVDVVLEPAQQNENLQLLVPRHVVDYSEQAIDHVPLKLSHEDQHILSLSWHAVEQ